MFRNAFRLIIVFFVALFVRRVISMILAAFSDMTKPATTRAPSPQAQQGTGELKKDPVCGTFVAVETSIKQKVDGAVVHFCSTACRDKYRAA